MRKKLVKKTQMLIWLLVLTLLLSACSGQATPSEDESKDQTPPQTENQPETQEPTLTAVCSNGQFVGQPEAETGVLSFKGIPFAKAPVGELRWKAPQAPEKSSETFQADDFGYTSIQYEWPSEPASYNEIGEDCLTLNIWTKDLESTGKPVMVYFHGGGFNFGGTADPLYNGQYFVERNPDIIMVTANYRVGLMGFIDFSHVEGGEDFPDAPVLGVLDHIQALKWIQENIKAFGGDPGNVTIFGESAGGGTTSQLVVTEAAQGLFHKCISESGSLNLTYSQEEFDETGLAEGLLAVTGAKNMDELMAIPEKDLIAYYHQPDEDGGCLNDLNNMPMRGGGLIPEDPYQAMADGVGKDIIFMTGTNANEWNYWIKEVALDGIEDLDEAAAIYEENIINPKLELTRAMSNAEESALIDRFMALQADKEPIWATTEFCNDIAFRVPSVMAAYNHAKAGGTSYMYYFAKDSNLEMMGASHASEVAYVFHNLKEEIFSGVVDEGLADHMCDAWANFARTGDPSTDFATWTPYTAEGRETMMIGNDCSMQMQNDCLKEQRELIEPLLKFYVK